MISGALLSAQEMRSERKEPHMVEIDNIYLPSDRTGPPATSAPHRLSLPPTFLAGFHGDNRPTDTA